MRFEIRQVDGGLSNVTYFSAFYNLSFRKSDYTIDEVDEWCEEQFGPPDEVVNMRLPDWNRWGKSRNDRFLYAGWHFRDAVDAAFFKMVWI